MEQEVVYESKMNVVVKDVFRKTYEVVLEIEPMGSVRTTAQGKFTDRAKMYHKYKEKLQWLWVDAMLKNGLKATYTLPGHIEYIEFGMSIENPLIGSKKQQGERLDMVGKPHCKKPDLDNMYKALVDAICYQKDDSHIHSLGGMRKVYAPYQKGYIKVVFYI